MIKFDKKGMFVGQVIKIKVNHDDDHDRFYYVIDSIIEYVKSEYTAYKHSNAYNDKIDGILKVIPFYQTKYNGEKFKKWYKKGSGALAAVSKSIRLNKIIIVKILIPKQIKD